jgi:hypothetical protein
MAREWAYRDEDKENKQMNQSVKDKELQMLVYRIKK